MLCGAATADIHSSGEWVKGIRMGICIIESPVIHCCSVAKSYRFFVTPWTAVYQVSLSFAISRSLLRLMSVELVMPSNISSSAALFFSCPHSSPASGSFPVSRLFASGGQSSGDSALVLSMNIQGWFPLGLTGLVL